MHNVLLVEPDEAFLAVLVDRLGGQREDITVHGVQDGATAVEVLEANEDIDLIISVAHEPGSVDGFQLILTGRELVPEARLIITTSLDAFQMHALSEHCVAHFIPRATNPDDLTSLATALLEGETDIAGQLDDLELLDIVVMACICERTATLHVRQDTHKGRIIFQEGRLVHGELGELDSDEAVFEMLALNQGDIFLQSRIEDFEPSIEEPWLDLLVRGLPSLAERRERYAAESEASSPSEASITEDDLGELLGLEDPSADGVDDSGQSLFSQEELLEMGDLRSDGEDPEDAPPLATSDANGSLGQHSGSAWVEPSDFTPPGIPVDPPRAPSHDLGRSAPQGSGRRFSRMPRGDADAPPPPSMHGGPPPPPLGPPSSPESNQPAPLLDAGGVAAALYELIERFQYDVPEFLASDVVHRGDGMSVATLSVANNYDSAVASAFFSDFLNACSRGIHGFGLAPDLEEIQITTNRHYILMRSVRGTPYLHLALIGREGNLGIARVVMRRYEPLFAQILPH